MIIFINGSMNSGKSTVARILSRKIPRCALLEIDSLHECIEWMSIKEAVPINLENAVSIIRNFAKRDINVVVPYPLSQRNYDYISDGLKDLDQAVHVFTLSPSLEVALTDRGSRTLTEDERERIRYHYGIGINMPSFGTIIDSTDQSPEETVGIILQSIKDDIKQNI